jgi:glucose-6-phosphate 1-dehydrogenase
VGTVRDVMQNHLFQVLANLAMEPPIRTDSESIRDEKVRVLKAIPPIDAKHLVRGQFQGYRQENGVASGSATETFAALRLEINSWRWKGVPFYIRAGKYLPVTCTEVIATFCDPPSVFGADAPTRNYLRFRISPDMTIAFGATVMGQSEVLKGKAIEMLASHRPSPEEMEAYERVLGDAMAGDSSHFAREDYVEEAWRIVDPILKNPPVIREYEKGTWGPIHSSDSVTPRSGWHDPVTTDEGDSHMTEKAA